MPPPQSQIVRTIVAVLVVILTVIGVWKFIDYRNQPPEVKEVISGK